MKVYTDIPHPVILSALSKIESVVKETYGPHGKGILLDSGGKQEIIDDGFAVLEQFELEDELENAVVKYIRDVSRTVNKKAGDGTTTAFLLVVALVRACVESDSNSLIKRNLHDVVDSFVSELPSVVAQIQKKSKSVKTVEELEGIALNSYRNKEMAHLIADTVHKVGADGVITIENSSNSETTVDIVTGMKIQQGYISPHFAQNDSKVTLKNPVIVITDEQIATIEPLMPIFEEKLKAGKKDFLIISDGVVGEALTTLIINKIQGQINVAAIKCPGFADKRYDLLEDVAVVTGGTVLSSSVSRPYSSLTKEDLGTAKSVVVTQDDTIIVGGGGDKVSIKTRASMLRNIKDKSEYDTKKTQERIASLDGGVAVISVGAPTESELDSIRMKVDDAVHSTQLAFKHGVVTGGAKAYLSVTCESKELSEALAYPRSVLEKSGGLSDDSVDATGVVISSLESAVSLAKNLILSGGIITFKKEKDD